MYICRSLVIGSDESLMEIHSTELSQSEQNDCPYSIVHLSPFPAVDSLGSIILHVVVVLDSAFHIPSRPAGP